MDQNAQFGRSTVGVAPRRFLQAVRSDRVGVVAGVGAVVMGVSPFGVGREFDVVVVGGAALLAVVALGTELETAAETESRDDAGRSECRSPTYFHHLFISGAVDTLFGRNVS